MCYRLRRFSVCRKTAWEQWSFTFKVWLGAADAPYLNELAQIEANLDRARGDLSEVQMSSRDELTGFTHCCVPLWRVLGA